MLCYKCKREIPDNSLVCPSCGAEMSLYERSKYNSGTDTVEQRHYLPMNWFKFLIYWALRRYLRKSVVYG